MGTNTSTIDKRWKLCIFASFIGCIILIVCLNYNHGSIDLSALRQIALSMTLSDQMSKPNMQFTKPSNFNVFEEGKKKSISKREGQCDIFKGKWVYDPKASDPLYHGHQCPFLSDQVSCQKNGRLDFDYEKWSWEAKECDIPRFNGTDMLERLRGQRVIIVGDSLNRNQWESLACLLYSSIPPSRAIVDVKSGIYKVFRAKDYNCSVEFYWSPFLVQLHVNQVNGSSSRVLRLDKLPASARQWHSADIMIFNTGHWWVHRQKVKAWDLFQYERNLVEKMEIESAFKMALKTWALWIDDNVDMTKTRVFFRSISPEHKGKQWCYNVTQPIMDESYVSTFPKPLIEIVEETIQEMRTRVRYLNITTLSQYRRDAHPTVYGRKQGKLLMENEKKRPESCADCSHWCLPGLPDTWNRLLYASLVFDTTRDISSTHLVV